MLGWPFLLAGLIQAQQCGPPPCNAGYCGPVCLSNVQCTPPTQPQCVDNSPICGGNTSPIIISWDGSPIQLTNAAGGAFWTFFPGRPPVHISWINSSSTNAFLVLPQQDGFVHNAGDMFGDLTPQPAVPSGRNGFNALSVYDLNHDGKIDNQDAIWSRLRLMRSDMSLHTLSEYGVTSISLDYERAGRVDQFGNTGRFRSVVATELGPRSLTVAWDWWLTVQPSNVPTQ